MEEIESEAIRQQVNQKLLEITDNYVQTYRELDPFFKRVHRYRKAMSEKDFQAISEMKSDFEAHQKNLKVFLADLKRFDSFGEEEQAVYYELSQELIEKATDFLVGIPDVIGGTEVGADVGFPE